MEWVVRYWCNGLGRMLVTSLESFMGRVGKRGRIAIGVVVHALSQGRQLTAQDGR